MYKINDALPADRLLCEKMERTLGRFEKCLTGTAFALALLAILGLFGIVVCLFLGQFGSVSDVVSYSALGGCAAGSVLFALVSVTVANRIPDIRSRRDDLLERMDGEESFFVGEGTLATFKEDSLVLHAGADKARVRIPYGEMRFFSVCSRTKPREEGDWTVVMEIPSHYLIKEKKADKGSEKTPALVQTDAKDRLYETLDRHGLMLEGARRGQTSEKKKFTRVERYFLPDSARRKRAYLLFGIGAVLVAACLPVALWQVTVGAIVGVFGILLLLRGGIAWREARSELSLYSEGLYWKESGRGESVFLKWEDILSVKAEQSETVLRVTCSYGDYCFPLPDGAWEGIRRNGIVR